MRPAAAAVAVAGEQLQRGARICLHAARPCSTYAPTLHPSCATLQDGNNFSGPVPPSWSSLSTLQAVFVRPGNELLCKQPSSTFPFRQAHVGGTASAQPQLLKLLLSSHCCFELSIHVACDACRPALCRGVPGGASTPLLLRCRAAGAGCVMREAWTALMLLRLASVLPVWIASLQWTWPTAAQLNTRSWSRLGPSQQLLPPALHLPTAQQNQAAPWQLEVAVAAVSGPSWAAWWEAWQQWRRQWRRCCLTGGGGGARSESGSCHSTAER